MKTLILFDVDGTLTPSRLQIKNDMRDTLQKLREKGFTLGIVGGSDLPKQEEQLGGKDYIFSIFDYVFSENGLDAYYQGERFHQQKMINFMGEDFFQDFINDCLKILSKITIPKKRGTFLETRTGMVNVCPIGRSCSQEEREEFFEFDKEHKIRELICSKINEKWENNLKTSIGGQISIDVFPHGWDKTYCLQFVENKFDKIYFFGDKTAEGGNDFEIFNDERTVGNTVTSPEDTIEQLTLLFLHTAV